MHRSTVKRVLCLLGLVMILAAGPTSPTFDGLVVKGTSSAITLGDGAGAVNPSMNVGASQVASWHFRTAGTNRWQFVKQGDSEAGRNTGSTMLLEAYTDAGADAGTLFGGARASGPMGDGKPYFSVLAPGVTGSVRAGAVGGVDGPELNYLSGVDIQPTTTLATSPITTVVGSPTITVHWPNCCGVTSGTGSGQGPLYNASGANEAWVNLVGATAVGGITPTGWLKVASNVGNDDFTLTWTSNATSSASGGGTPTVTPSFTTQGTKSFMTLTTGGAGYPVGHTDYVVANPSFYHLTGTVGPQYQREFSQVYSPNDTAQTHAWGTVDHEMDLINRGADEGYYPNLYGAPRPTIGIWAGVEVGIGSFVPGGGVPVNWNTVFSCFSGNRNSALNFVAVYNCNSNQPDSLVGATNDPTGHGGVGYDFFGAQDTLASIPFATVNGLSTVTATLNNTRGFSSLSSGATVHLYGTRTVNNVTFGDANYVLTCTEVSSRCTGTTFTFTGSGVANATGTGGSAGLLVSFAPLVPYAPVQFQGEFKHGLIVHASTKFDDALVIHARPSQGIGWDDGTGTASVTGTEITAGNVDIDLTPAGTGSVNVHGNLTASAVATGSATPRTLAARYAEVYNVLDNGVVCDGTTNGAGTDNAAALNALITRAALSATVAHRVAIYFPPVTGACLVSDTVIPKSYIDMIANPGTAVLAPTSGATTPSGALIFNFTFTTDALMYGLTLDGGLGYTVAPNADRLVLLTGNTGLRIEKNVFRHTRGAAIERGGSFGETRVGIKDNNFFDVGNRWKTTGLAADRNPAIVFDTPTTQAMYSTDVSVTGNTMSDIGLDPISVVGVRGAVIANNVLTLNGALQWSHSYTNYPDAISGTGSNVTITGNVVRNAAASCIAFTFDNATVTGNTCDTPGRVGLLVQGSNVTAVGNTFSNTNTSLLYTDQNAAVTIIGLATNVVVSDNRIADLHTQYARVISGSAVVTNLFETTMFSAGNTITGVDVPGGTTVLSVDSPSQITMSANATGSNKQELLTIGTPTMRNCFQAIGNTSTNATGDLVNVHVKPDNSCVGASVATFEAAGGNNIALTWGMNYGSLPLTGVTAAIGGNALAAGACESLAVTVSGATVGMRVVATPAANPLVNLTHGLSIVSYVSATDQVTVDVCAIIATTPTATTYNVQAFN